MMKKTLVNIFAAVLALCAAAPMIVSAQSQIVIERTSKKSNPTLIFKGVSGDTALSEKVRTNLQACGWFDLISSGASDYIISGSAAGDKVTLSLMNGAGTKIRDVSDAGTDVKTRADAVVDSALNALFGIAGICRTKIVFSAETTSTQRDIYMCNFDGSGITRITDNRSLSVEPVWTPDGKSLIYCYYGFGYTNLVQYRFDIKKSRRLTQYKGLNTGGSLSPDGKYVALVLGRGNQVDLYIRKTEGGDLIRLTNDKAVEASPAWTPDGKKICFVSDMGGRPQLYMVDPFSRTRPARLPNLRGTERVTPDFASDGMLAYSAKVGGDYVITVVSMKDPSSPQLEPIGSNDSSDIPGEGPSWAPDNRHVVVSFKGQLFIVDTWLGRKRCLVSGKSRVFQPDWSPILK